MKAAVVFWSLFSLLSACKTAPHLASGVKDDAEEPGYGSERARCDMPFTAALSAKDVILTSNQVMNVRPGDGINLFALEEGTSFEISLTAQAPNDHPNTNLITPVADLVQWTMDGNGTCPVVASAQASSSSSLTAVIRAQNLAAGNYRVVFPRGGATQAENFVLKLGDVQVTTPILYFPEQGTPQFIDTDGNPAAESGFKAGHRLQVRYDYRRLTDRFPGCLKTDEIETGDLTAKIFMGVKVNGADRSSLVQVGGHAEGDGTDAQPVFGDITVPAEATALSLWFVCSDQNGERHYDNNGVSGGAYAVEAAP